MFRLLLVLCGVAAVVCSAPQQVEEYQYRSTIKTGVLNTHQTFSGSQIAMTVKVTRHPDQSADVEFTNPQIGSFNREEYAADPMRMYPQSLSKYSELEGKIKVYFTRETGTVMEVPSSEEIWKTNIRKAVVSMLKIPPYMGQQKGANLQMNSVHQPLFSSSGSKYSSYYVTEEVFAGRCNVSYTMSPDSEEGKWPGSPSSVLSSEPSKYYRLHRSFDFDSCSDAVSMQKTSTGNFSQVHMSQFKEVQGRSVHTEYLLFDRGDGFYDVKGALQLGEQYVRPFGQDTGRVLTQTNQTLTLTKLSKGSSAASSSVSGSLKPITTWKYQLTSPAAPGSSQETKVDWVNYQSKGAFEPVYPEYAILGNSVISESDSLKQTNQILDRIADLQLKQIQYHNKPYNGTTDGRLAENLALAARSIRTLSLKSIQSLHSSTEAGQSPTAPKHDRVRRQSFLDASITSGSSAAIKAFLDAAKAKKIDDIRIAGLITAMVNSIYDPEIISELMSYVKTIDVKSKPYLGIQSHLNFARLAQRVCTQKDTKRYSVPQAYLGKKACSSSPIESDFVSYLQNKIKSSGSIWEALVYTQALGSLGVDSSIPFLRDIAQGKIKSDLHVRMGGIHAMGSFNFPEGSGRDRVINELLALVESHTEDYRIRESALVTMVSLYPNTTIFQRLAHDTSRDPSSRVRSMVYSTFLALAESNSPTLQRTSNIARKLLPLMKPVQPSVRDSLLFKEKTRLHGYKIDIESTVSWMSKFRSAVAAPQQLYTAVTGDFGGIVVPLMEGFSMLGSGSVRKLADSFRSVVNNPGHRRIHQEISELSDSLELEMSSNDDDIFVYFSAFNYQTFLSSKSSSGQTLPQTVQAFLQKEATNSRKPFLSNYMVKFFNPVDIVSVLPTPFGIPAIVEVATPNNWLWDYDYTMSTSQQQGHTINNLTLYGQCKLTMKSQTYMKVLLPWHNTTATAGFDTEATISFPGNLGFSYNNTFPYTILKHEISPSYRGQIPLLYWRSKPLSAIRSIAVSTDLTDSSNLIVPIANRSSSYNTTVVVPMSLLGLKAKFRFQGDVDFPFQQTNVIQYLKKPERIITLLTTPTSKDTTIAYEVNMDQSQTKNITLGLAADFGFLSEGPSYLSKSSSPQQAGQQIAQKLSSKTSLESKVGAANRRELGDFLISLTANYTAPNQRTRSLEFTLTGSNHSRSGAGELQQTLVLNLMTSGTQGGGEGERKTCFVSTLKEKVSPSSCSKQQSQRYTTSITDIYAGSQCSSGEKIGSVRGEWFMSHDERDVTPSHNPNSLRASPGGPCIDHLTDNTPRTPWIQDAIYDRVNLELNYFKELPSWYRNFSNYMGDLAEGSVFPHAVKNHQPGSNKPAKDSAIVNITRNVPGGVMDAWVHTSESIVEITNLPVWPVFDWMSPLIGSRQRYQHHISQSGLAAFSPFATGGRCVASAQQVTTFDGVKYNKQPCTCWTVAAQLYQQQESFTILTRQAQRSQETEVKILAPTVSKIEVLEGQQVKLNDQQVSLDAQIKNSTGQIVGSVKRSGSNIVISVPSKFEVVVEDKKTINIHLPERYRSNMKGLCGDYNADTAAELKSPKNVVFAPRRGEEFAATWVPQAMSCSDPSFKSIFERAQAGRF